MISNKYLIILIAVILVAVFILYKKVTKVEKSILPIYKKYMEAEAEEEEPVVPKKKPAKKAAKVLQVDSIVYSVVPTTETKSLNVSDVADSEINQLKMKLGKKASKPLETSNNKQISGCSVEEITLVANEVDSMCDTVSFNWQKIVEQKERMVGQEKIIGQNERTEQIRGTTEKNERDKGMTESFKDILNVFNSPVILPENVFDEDAIKVLSINRNSSLKCISSDKDTELSDVENSRILRDRE